MEAWRRSDRRRAAPLLAVEAAADLIWVSANAAAQLHVTARLRKAVPPSSAVLEQVRESALRTVLNRKLKGISL